MIFFYAVLLYKYCRIKHAKSGDDITRSVLTQIIADQEAGEETLLPTDFLRSIIGFYGNNMQSMLPSYLNQTMAMFSENQERMQEQINKSFEGMRSMEGMFPQNKALEDLTRKNMEMFERAMKMMPPFNMGYMSQDDAGKDKKES